MRTLHLGARNLALLLAFVGYGLAQPESSNRGLGGTSWQLVQFQGGDDKVLTAGDRSKYTLTFDNEGAVFVRIDCNRGRGSWKSLSPGQLEFGPLALTRAMCPSAPLNDRLAKDWTYVRSYVLKNGHLFLSLMADGGIYEWEPMAQKSENAVVKGSAAYRERMAIPSGAVLEVTLEDVSRVDAAADVIGRSRVENPGNPPIPFEIAYDPSRINTRHRYSVRGRILVDGKLMFTTDQAYPVLTAGNGNEVQLLLRRTGGNAAAAQSLALENQYWKLARIDGNAVTISPKQKEPHLIFDSKEHRVSGSGGCNRVAGSYQIEGNKLKLGQMAGTMMACMEGMDTEQAMMNALQRAASFRIAGQQLELLDAGGKAVVTFEAGQTK